jgi:hypothetical protein
MWDAINAVVEEYVRSCALAKLERRDKEWNTLLNATTLSIRDSGPCLLALNSLSTTYAKLRQMPY